MRYAPKSILPFDDNIVVHQFFKGDFLNDVNSKTLSIMNDNIIRMSFNLIRKVSSNQDKTPVSFSDPLTQYLLDELNLRPTVEDFQKIRDKNIKLCVVGYGGAMINVLYNMYIWAMELGTSKIFDKLAIFEQDDIDFTNILRIGKPMVFDYSPDFIKEYDSEVPNIKTMKKLNIFSTENELSKERKGILFARWLEQISANFLAKKDYIFVGAPTLETRQMLSDKNFFFLGHSDYEVDITFRPQSISSLAVETYGSIDIPVLLINMQIATASFIKILAGEDTFEPDQRILNFDLKDWIEKNPEKLKELYV
jgi:hypothetical protein